VIRFVLVVLGAALTLWPSSAAAASVTGRFLEKASGPPLAGVEVVLRTAADSTVAAHALTDSTGRFRMDGLKPGRYLFRASLVGYVPYRRADVEVTESTPNLDLGAQLLAVSPIAVKGVETSTARSTMIVAADRNIYLAKDLPAAAGTATELLRAVPELDVDIDDKVSIRGSSSVTIQLNGRTSPLKGDALATFLRQFPASRIERVEVLSNPSAKFDPEGMAGIVNIVTKEPLDLGLSGSVFLTAGDRSAGPSSRIAWQKGKVTLYGGLSGFWNRLAYQYEDLRTNLLTRPPSSYHLNSDSKYVSGFGNGDGSFDYAFDKRSTLYGTLTAYVSTNESDGLTGYVLSDSAQTVTSRYDRASDGNSDWRSGTATLGFRRVLVQNRNEWTLELRHNESPNTNASNSTEHLLVPVEEPGQVTLLEGDTHSRERSAQVDDITPLGSKGKLELGYRGAERRNASWSRLHVISGSSAGSLTDYVHREVFHSGYVTASNTFGRLSVQGGVRAELASTSFEVVPRATRYHNDYESVFPSANLAWDFSKGRTLRLTYAKRVERPSAGYLNPEVPTADSLNRTEGNPYLEPKYTHQINLEASWQGSKGLLRLSPFFKQTIHNWDQFKRVNAEGVAVTTWLNATSIRYFGGSVTGSLRQVGRLGGSLSMSVYRELHDATNLSRSAHHDATAWQVSSNVVYKLTKSLDLQSWARYSPAQTLAQGRVSGILYSNVGARQKFGDKAWLSVYVNDPFKLWKYSYTSSDPSYVQSSTNHGSIRRTSLSFGWSWGKPPETKPRKQTDEQPQQDPQVQVR
jgi:hypothetical protein